MCGQLTLHSIVKQTCRNVAIEPALQPQSGESLRFKSACSDDGSRLDIKAKGLWDCSHQSAFLDVRVFNPLADSYKNKPLSSCYSQHE